MSAASRSALVAIIIATGGLPAQTKYPYIDLVHPVAVSRGKSADVRVHATGKIRGATAALVDGPGVKASIAATEEKLPDGEALVRIEVAEEAPAGVRDIRLATEDAITTVGRLLVTDRPVTVEDKASSEPAGQEIALPCVVAGRVSASVEVDRYRFRAVKGERVSFDLLGARLHETIHHVGRFTPHFDGFLAIEDGTGVEIASSDDFFYGDPLLSLEVPADGEYRVVVREANYRGHASYTYALSACRGPVAVLTFPLAVPPGKPADVEIIGPGMTSGTRGRVELPADAERGRVHPIRAALSDGSLAAQTVAASSDLPPSLEEEGVEAAANDDADAAQAISLPAGVDGRIGRPDDVDCFSFEAKKGSSYTFQVFARRLFSPLDAEITILDAKKKTLAAADDGRDLANRATKDPFLAWTAPDDGRYALRIRDLHQRGGRDFVYRIDASAVEPSFELTMDPAHAMISPGNRTAVYARAQRRGGFDGEIALEVEGLPEGVSAIAAPIRSGMTDACVILEAAPGAPRSASIFRIRGKATAKRADGSEVALARVAVPLVEIYQAQRVEGRTAAIAVTSPSDIEVTAALSEVVLRPGETAVIPVRIVRGPRYASGPVTLWSQWRYEGAIFGSSLPPGVQLDEGQSRTSLNGDSLEGAIALRATPDAKPISKVQTAILGLVPIEFSVFVPYATQPIYVSVVPPAP